MFPIVLLLAASSIVGGVRAEVRVERDIPYAQPPNVRQTLDVYAPEGAKSLPVVVWVHGGGWQVGDKSGMAAKPAALAGRGMLFVAVNYRFVPHVAMGDIVRDVAGAVGWVHRNIASRGGDPGRIYLMGHSAGAQLAALVAIDGRYLGAEGVPLWALKGCVPVDGDTYDVPLQVATARARRWGLGQPEPKLGHPEKFGPPDLQRDLSAVRHIAPGKGIPPFLILHVAGHADTTAQAHRLWSELREAGIAATLFGADDTDHVKLDRNLGVEGDPATAALFAFLDQTGLRPGQRSQETTR